MAIRWFLAMTAAEFSSAAALPPSVAWMACHFSPYGLGLSNLPHALPAGSLLILNDRTPIAAHDPDVIAQQLLLCIQRLHCSGLLLDFQRPGEAHAAHLAKHLSHVLPCPVGVSESYAPELTGPVFVSPVPPDVPLSSHLAFWQGREIWLDISPTPTCVTLTPEGAGFASAPCPPLTATAFEEKALHCHYQTRLTDLSAEFLLWRTPEDLRDLTAEAAAFGVSTCIGLYQELAPYSLP